MNRTIDNFAELPFASLQRIDEACDRFEAAFQSGGKPRLEDFLEAAPPEERRTLFRELLRIEIHCRFARNSEETVLFTEYQSRFPTYQADLKSVFDMSGPPQDPSGPAKLPAQFGPASLSVNTIRKLGLPFQFGAYQLQAEVGQGGMGTVFRAVHLPMNRPAAVKLMLSGHMPKAEAIARFKHEVQAVASLQHLNIVMAYDAGEFQGLPFLAMEFVRGWNLSVICKGCGRLPIPTACECVRQAAVGLQHVFENRLVHRDIKPSNLMLTEAGVVKLLDLGLARLHDEERGECLTRELTPIGTIEYMAPEQARNAHGVDIRADLYSLGCTLFKLLTGFPPFPQENQSPLQVLFAHRDAAPPRLQQLRPEVPADLDDLVDQLLRKEPAQRLQTPREVADALQPFCETADLPAFANMLAAVQSKDGHLPNEVVLNKIPSPQADVKPG